MNNENLLEKTKTISTIESLMNFLKSMIGTSILGLPCAFKHGGLWVGFVFSFIFGIAYLYSMHLLVKSSNYIYNRSKIQKLGYGEVVEYIFANGQPRLTKLARPFKMIINSYLIFTLLSNCSVNQLFVCENLKLIIESCSSFRMSTRLYSCLMLVFLLPYSLIRNFKVLAIFSGVANVFLVLGFCLVLANCVKDLPPLNSRPAFASWKTLPFFITISMYSLEGLSMVMPLHNQMTKPDNLNKPLGVLNFGMSLTITLNILIGFFGYLKFGEEVAGSITLNLPQNGMYNFVRAIFVIAIFITIGIDLYVPMLIIWPWVEGQLEPNSCAVLYGEYILRTILILFTFLLATLVSHIELLISLVGSCSILFIVPPVLDILIIFTPNEVQKAPFLPNISYSKVNGVSSVRLASEDEKIRDLQPLETQSNICESRRVSKSVSEETALVSREGNNARCCSAILFCRVLLDFVIILFGILASIFGTVLTVGEIAHVFKEEFFNN